MDLNYCVEELKELIKALCAIPAPSLKEEKRAGFCKNYFCEAGFDAYCDETNNAIAPWNLTESNDIIVFMAHSDTVFPDEEPMPYREENGKAYCPGIGDDTANLAILMLAAKILKQRAVTPKCGILFVANAAEEGLGNLKGSKAIASAFGDRIKEWISFDLGQEDMFVRAVGSARYQLTVTTEGGHSYEDFGNDSAIERIARIVRDLYAQALPEIAGTKTTYNVGAIQGGTSINTIAQQAELLYEYRSDSNEGLAYMEKQLQEILSKHERQGTSFALSTVGIRPGMGVCKDPERQQALFQRAEETVFAITGKGINKRSASTDCNVPFSLGIPAVCFGLITMAGAHTREEWISLDSLSSGLAIALKFIESTIL